jgi:hypothetical protein
MIIGCMSQMCFGLLLCLQVLMYDKIFGRGYKENSIKLLLDWKNSFILNGKSLTWLICMQNVQFVFFMC